MTIVIDQVHVQELDSLSHRAKLILDQIPEGSDWLNFQLKNSAVHHFVDEQALVGAINRGVHNSDIVYLESSDLFVNPIKLFHLNNDDLNVLCDHIPGVSDQDGHSEDGLENNGNDLSHDLGSQIINTLNKNNLFNEVALRSTSRFIDGMGLSSSPIFRYPSLQDCIDLVMLDQESSQIFEVSKNIKTEAVAFSESRVRAAPEFCDLFRFYLYAIQGLEISNVKKGARKNAINSLYEMLKIPAGDLLKCPSVSRPLAEAEINQTVKNWIGAGNIVGFSSLTSALFCLVTNLDLKNTNSSNVAIQVDQCIQEIQSLLVSTDVVDAELSQDGESWRYFYKTDQLLITLNLDKQGALTLMGAHRNTPTK